jgi:hypothetical protein
MSWVWGLLCAALAPSVATAQAQNYGVITEAFDYNDLAGIGTSVTLLDDSLTDVIPLPFTFDFFGHSYDAVVISSNGCRSCIYTHVNINSQAATLASCV